MSYGRNFRHWLHKKLSKWQLLLKFHQNDIFVWVYWLASNTMTGIVTNITRMESYDCPSAMKRTQKCIYSLSELKTTLKPHDQSTFSASPSQSMYVYIYMHIYIMYKKVCITTFPFFRLHLLHMSCVTSCIIFFTLRTNLLDLSRKSHDAPVPYPNMHQKCAHMPHTWDTFLMHWGTYKMDLIRIITLLSRHPLSVIDYQFPLSDIRATLVISLYGDKKNKQHKKIEWLPPLRSFKMFTGPYFEIKLY